MSRAYPQRYKILSGPLTGQIFDGVEIAAQDYPDQCKVEGCAKGEFYGVWLNEPKVKINRDNYRNVVILDEGVNYNDAYLDLCVPFDRFGNEIFVGDTIYISSNNEVIPCVVEKIAKKPYMANYGVMGRKLTARPTEGGMAKTIGDSRSTVKAPKI